MMEMPQGPQESVYGYFERLDAAAAQCAIDPAFLIPIAVLQMAPVYKN